MELLPAFTHAPETNRVYCVDAMTLLKAMPSESVNCIVTSPPYFGLRSYMDNDPREIGKEQTPAEYVARLVELFREARRVLRDDGTFWINLGDTWSNAGKWGGNKGYNNKQSTNGGSIRRTTRNAKDIGAKPKDLLMVPARVAIALQDDGWYLRDEIVWFKPNPMPASVEDRTTRAHEMIYLLSKKPHYWYDANAIKEPAKEVSLERLERGRSDHHKNINGAPGQTNQGINSPRPNVRKTGGDFSRRYADQQTNHGGESHRKIYEMVNKRSVWEVSLTGFPGAHFATYPEKLIEPCILAGCPVGGLVLDPFMGSGTTARVAFRWGRQFIGSEINSEYVAIHDRLIRQVTPDMFTFLEAVSP